VKFLHWSKEFIKWVQARRITLNKPNFRFLLLLDSHSSRENPEALQLLKDANVDVYTYPGECSHILQALDVFIFGPFKKYYKIQMRSMRSQKFTWKDENVPSDAGVRRLKSLLAAVNGLKQACTYTNIQKVFFFFERSGIYPRDVNAALKNPRLNQSILEEEVPILIENTPKRKKLSITSQCITKDSVIDAIKARDEEKKRKNIEKNEREEAKKQKTKKKKASVNTISTPSLTNPPSISPALLSFRDFQTALLRSTTAITPLDKQNN